MIACTLFSSLLCCTPNAPIERADRYLTTRHLIVSGMYCGTWPNHFVLGPDQMGRAGDSLDRALAFDGIDDFVTVPAIESMTYPGTGGWTFEFWVKPIVYPFEGEVSIVGQESVGVSARDPWSCRIHPTHFEFRVDDADGNSDSIRFDMRRGVWQHVACVYQNDEVMGQTERWMAVYVDGVLIDRQATEILMDSRLDAVYMGALQDRRFRGLIDDVRVWAGAIEESTGQLVFQEPFDAFSPRLRGWWSFNADRGPFVVDWSRKGSHAILGKPHEPENAFAPTRVLRSRSDETRQDED